MNQQLPFKRLSATSYNDNNSRRLNTKDDMDAPTSYALLDEGNGNHSLYTLNGCGELENKIDANWILMKGIEDTIFKTGLTHTEIELSDVYAARKARLFAATHNLDTEGRGKVIQPIFGHHEKIVHQTLDSF